MAGYGQEQPRIRTYYTAQSLEQMQDARPLIFESLRPDLEAAINREFVKP